MSLLSAFKGETYRTRTPAGTGSCLHSPSRQARKAASVLPEPVGARMSVCLPAAIRGQLSRCAGVGSPSAARNHSRTGARKRERESFAAGMASVRIHLVEHPKVL